MSKTLVTVLGIVLVGIGLLGYVMNPLFGIFVVDGMHNVVHILTGVLALGVIAMGEGALRTFARVFGVMYLLLGLWGFVSSDGMILGMTMNMPDHILHLVLGLVFLWVGFAMRDEIPQAMHPESPVV